MSVSRWNCRDTSKLVPLGMSLSICLAMTGSAMALDPGEEDYDLKLLGKYVFFDKISNPPRMACVTCHDPKTGGTGSISGVNLHEVAITGANPHTVGNLKPPSNAYASLIAPMFTPCAFGVPGICGGNFWNGRAAGGDYQLNANKIPVLPAAGIPPLPVLLVGVTKHIGDEVFQNGAGRASYRNYFGPTADQALNPMPNPVEQNIQRQGVCDHVASAKYAELYEKAWGEPIDCSNTSIAQSAPDVNNPPEKEFDIAFKRVMLAVGAWQHSSDINSFSSKRDAALFADRDNTPGEFPLADFTAQENLGHDLFYKRRPGQNGQPCAACHSDNPGTDNGAEIRQLYADDGYHNIGVPRNPEIPPSFDASGNLIDPDLGLKGLTGQERHRGFFKTPTLRNVDKRKGNGFTKAYTHNGWFKSLESLVHFYNTADVNGATAKSFGITRCPSAIKTEKDALAHNCWPAPAVAGNGIGSPAIPAFLGDLGLTSQEEAAIVAYMKTFTDRNTVVQPPPYKSSKS